ncbi:hypothetical protein P5673_015340 [Acropora cervicornis]|uniref:Uncharacterized protein n=1 Tax=Acropora cervicornis TaxID=6130 RepID=A0AAD9V5X8_ACRCE|nr:hypothetical protein P5673_015340 [Acropora cervicornis]
MAAHSEKVPKGEQSRAQEAVDHVSNWSAENLLQLNLKKTKELTISFQFRPYSRHYNFRRQRTYNVPAAKRKRFANSIFDV